MYYSVDGKSWKTSDETDVNKLFNKIAEKYEYLDSDGGYTISIEIRDADKSYFAIAEYSSPSFIGQLEYIVTGSKEELIKDYPYETWNKYDPHRDYILIGKHSWDKT